MGPRTLGHEVEPCLWGSRGLGRQVSLSTPGWLTGGSLKEGGDTVPTHLQEVLRPLWVTAITPPAYPLDFLDPPYLTGSLNVFQVHVWILAKVHN